jgi:hypothetical protein
MCVGKQVLPIDIQLDAAAQASPATDDGDILLTGTNGWLVFNNIIEIIVFFRRFWFSGRVYSGVVVASIGTSCLVSCASRFCR